MKINVTTEKKETAKQTYKAGEVILIGGFYCMLCIIDPKTVCLCVIDDGNRYNHLKVVVSDAREITEYEMSIICNNKPFTKVNAEVTIL